ncbi:hypothetical protein NEOLEDRAFT_1125670 [Neolentinus lepideus HHB14362 ss-1]|uniref:DUF6532 domain-containing protein n=1 Tax=Neolentinus lepideus HHB14362 ss-1 TaxID=1314782 RepID=A0A165MCT8_9AGAM|nr:hypothetical protein NEOLEDRAFT_1125670 [Neolentinus lepideus HHB14362 ss-1]
MRQQEVSESGISGATQTGDVGWLPVDVQFFATSDSEHHCPALRHPLPFLLLNSAQLFSSLCGFLIAMSSRGRSQQEDPPETLTPAQKSALTRLKNRLAQEAKDKAELKKPKVPRDAKVQAVAKAVWNTGGQGRKRAGSATMPTEANEAKKTKKDRETQGASNKVTKEPRERHKYPAPQLGSDVEEERVSTAAMVYRDAHDSESSEDDDAATDDEERADREAQDLESDNEYLTNLAPVSLANALDAENPVWQDDAAEPEFDPVLHAPVKYRRKYRSASASSFNSSNVSVPEDDRQSDDEQILVVQKARGHSSKPKTTTRSAARLFDNDDEVIDGREGTRSEHGKDEASNVLPQCRGPVKSKSKRQLAHEAEAPTWHDTNLSESSVKGRIMPQGTRRNTSSQTHPLKPKRAAAPIVDDRSKSGEDSEHDTDVLQYDMTVLVYNARGKLNLTTQTEEIQAVIRRAIDISLIEILTVNSYPDVTMRTKLVRDACVNAAVKLGDHYKPILIKLLDEKQKEFVKALSNIPDARISLARGEVRDAALGQVVGHYGLIQGCGKHVAELLKEQRYIFSVNPHSGTVNAKEPYRHPAVLAVVRQAYFQSKMAKFVATILSLSAFSSSLKDRDEPELPAAMVALASTAIHAAISEWSSGTVLALDFSGNGFASVYNSHIVNLNHIRTTRPNMYHDMMSWLLREACGRSNPGLSAEDAEPGAISLMDLSGLD